MGLDSVDLDSIPLPRHAIINDVTLTPDKRPKCTIIIYNKKIPALWDTGSAVSLFTTAAVKTFLPSLKRLPCNITLKSANGSPLTGLRRYLVKFTINDHTAVFPFIISDNLHTTCILGSDFMAHFNYFISPRTGHAVRDISPYLNATSPHHSTVSLTHPLTAHSDITVPPSSEKVVKVDVPTDDTEISVNPDNQLIPHSLVVVAPAIVNVNNRTAHVVVSNPTLFPFKITQSQPICSFQPLSPDSSECLSVNAILKPTNTTHTSQGTASSATIVQADMSNIPQCYRAQFQALLQKYSNLLNDAADDIGHCELMPQNIELKDPSKITCTPPYHIPPALTPVVDHFVDKLLAAGVIRPSNSPFSSPLMLVKKANADPTKPLLEQYRVVNDFRKLNANTIKDSYPMRNIYDLIEQVAASKVATVIDLRSAFFVQQLTENSRAFTSFPVPGRGLFEYCRSPQGLINSPSAFQRLLDHIMCDIPNVKVYIDDIVIYNNSFPEHLKTLNKVLHRLQQHNFKCSVKKLQLAKGTIHYLGYEIKPGHYIRPGVAKTKAIANWQPPADVSQIRQFLGLCGFFRRTINHYAEIAAPLTRLT